MCKISIGLCIYVSQALGFVTIYPVQDERKILDDATAHPRTGRKSANEKMQFAIWIATCVFYFNYLLFYKKKSFFKL